MVKSVLQAFSLLGLSVAVHSFAINFNTPQQCDVVQIAWTNPSTSAAQLSFPLLLHILPFDSLAITQEIYGWNASMMSGSATVNFNLSGGTSFLLAVTDQLGQGAGPVSEVKVAGKSQDSSCLSILPTSHGHFQVFTTFIPSDCPSLTVGWDGSVKSPRPTVLGFSPGSYPVNLIPLSSPTPVERTITFKGAYTSMSQVVVLFRDSDSIGRTSQFLTVGGTDQNGCSSPPVTTAGGWATAPTNTSVTCQHHDISSSNTQSAGKVFGGVAAGVLGLATVLFLIFAYIRYRQRRAKESSDEPGVSSEKVDNAPSTTGDVPDAPDITSENVPPSGDPPSPSTETIASPSQGSQNEGDLTSIPSSTILANAVPVMFPKSPSARRRSWVRSRPSIATEESTFLSLRPSVSSGKSVQVDGAARPDSPTLPELPPVPTVPSTPTTSRPRSQRSEKRSNYIKLDAGADIQVSAEMRSPRSMSSPSWKSRSKKAD